MQNSTQEAAQQAAAPKGSGLGKCILILLAVSIALSVVLAIATGQHIDPSDRFGTAHFIGAQLAYVLLPFLISLLFFTIIRLSRPAGVPTAGLGTGIVVMLIWDYLAYVGHMMH